MTATWRTSPSNPKVTREQHWGYTFYEKRPFHFRSLFIGTRKKEAWLWVRGWRYIVGYVGESANPVGRLRGHASSSVWFPEMKRKGFVWEVFPLFNGQPVEKVYAQREWEVPEIHRTLPLYNRKHNLRKPTDPLTIVKLRLGSTTRKKINRLYRLVSLATLAYTLASLYLKIG